MPQVAIVAGEASGDASAAALALEMHKACPNLSIWGAGGDRMRDVGVELVADFSSCGAIGIIESLKLVPRLIVELRRLKREFLKRRPDVFVMVDFGAFNVTLGRFARENDIPTVYYFPPGSWRRRPKDHSKLIAASDKIITPFPWSAQILANAGGDVAFLGHPMLDRVAPTMPKDEFLGTLKCEPGTRVIGLLPGSRSHEINNILPVFLKAGMIISEQVPSVKDFVIASASERAGRMIRGILNRLAAQSNKALRYYVVQDATYNIMAHSDLLLTCSGTATLEAMILGTPMVIVYRGSGLMKLEYLFRNSILEEFIGMPNICAGKSICPELLGDDASPGEIAKLSIGLLDSPGELDRMKRNLHEARQVLGEPGATAKSAQVILESVGLLS